MDEAEERDGTADPSTESKPRRSKRQAAVTTRTGDAGYTGLLGKERVPKWDPRPETFGTLDEATSALGLARAMAQQERVKAIVLRLQQELYLLMAELATGADEYERSPFKLTLEHVVGLEALAEELKAQVEIGRQFIIPGETAAGAALDLARTIVRRGERLAARLTHEGVIGNAEVLRYLNRLSDVLFILARYEEAQTGHHSRPSKDRQ
jgi:cob(I)alamin adenosyltransferase